MKTIVDLNHCLTDELLFAMKKRKETVSNWIKLKEFCKNFYFVVVVRDVFDFENLHTKKTHTQKQQKQQQTLCRCFPLRSGQYSKIRRVNHLNTLL
jgi:hypothetical protein